MIVSDAPRTVHIAALQKRSDRFDHLDGRAQILRLVSPFDHDQALHYQTSRQKYDQLNYSCRARALEARKVMRMTVTRREIGDLLVDNGVITEQDLELARLEHQKSGGSIIGVLSRLGLANESHCQNALELEYGVNYVTLLKGKNPPEPEAVMLLPEELMRKYQLVCIHCQGERAIVAMVDPSDNEAIERVKEHLTGLTIKPVVCVEDELIQFLDQFFRQKQQSETGENGSGSANSHLLGAHALEKTEDIVQRVSGAHSTVSQAADEVINIDSRLRTPTMTGLEALPLTADADELHKRAQEQAIVLLANQILPALSRATAQIFTSCPGSAKQLSAIALMALCKRSESYLKLCTARS